MLNGRRLLTYRYYKHAANGTMKLSATQRCTAVSRSIWRVACNYCCELWQTN